MLKESLSDYEEGSPHFSIIKATLDRDITPEELAEYDLQIIRATRDSDREIAKAHNHLGLIYAMQKKVDLAAAHFERSLQIWPGNVDATRNLEKLRLRSRSVPSEPKQEAE